MIKEMSPIYSNMLNMMKLFEKKHVAERNTFQIATYVTYVCRSCIQHKTFSKDVRKHSTQTFQSNST